MTRRRCRAGAEECSAPAAGAASADAAAAPRFNYSGVFADTRDAGLSFWGGCCAAGQLPAAPSSKEAIAGCWLRPLTVGPLERLRRPAPAGLAADLPGFSRSVYAADHALVTPESRVWAPNTYGW